MKRHTRWFALLAAVLLIAASCSSDGENADSGSSNGGSATSQDLKGSTLEVAAVWSGDEQANFQKVLKKFEDDTGATVKFTSTGDDIATIVGGRIEGGSPPDIAVLPQPGLLKEFAQKGDLKSIEEAAGSTVDENYDKTWRDLGTVDGTLYGVWFKASNKSTFWYDIKALDDAGVKPPEDWKSLIDDSQTLLDSGITPISVAGADGWTLTDWFENVYIRQAGPEMYDKLATHQIPWTDDSVVKALDTMGQVIGQDKFVVDGLKGALQIDFPTSVTNVFGNNPKGAMVYEGDFVAGNITGETDSKLGTDADFVPFPSVDGSEPAVVGGGDVAVMLTSNKASEALIKYLATPEAAEIWAEAGGFTSPNKNVDTSVYPDATTKKSAENLVDAKVFRFDLSDLQPAAFGSTPGQGLFKLFQDWLADPTQSKTIAQNMETAAAAAY
ncbi:MAG: extracellular solute-binding protein [Microthrixaceae bacterium]